MKEGGRREGEGGSEKGREGERVRQSGGRIGLDRIQQDGMVSGRISFHLNCKIPG